MEFMCFGGMQLLKSSGVFFFRFFYFLFFQEIVGYAYFLKYGV